MKKRITASILLLIIILGIIVFIFIRNMNGPYDPGNTSTFIVDIPMGSSTDDIGGILQYNGIIGNATGYKIYSRLKGYDGKYVAGTYVLSPSMTSQEICDTLTGGETLTVKITVPEGYTIFDIADLLNDTESMDGDKFLNLVEHGDYSQYDFLKYAVKDKHRLEGYLFPDTYLLPPGSDEEALIIAMLDRFNEMYTEEYKSKGNKMGYNINEILTVASIIEKETMHLEDKATVASVIYNRLDIDMPLQMDTTVIYAMRENKVDLTYDDIAIESPYNTYLIDGLPQGPICSPGLDSIEAALNPAKSDYYYFVVSDKGDGSIKFSETSEEFEKDKDAYYASVGDESDE